ncbi:YaiO family outer membrane beta-barrel protein [Escherichia coli]|nr:YaiO family outer membrane beta-barrel protein [Escherichia coli]
MTIFRVAEGKMNKYKFSMLTLLLVGVNLSVQAAESGRFESSIAGAHVTGPYEGGKSFKSYLLLNLEGKNKLGFSYLALDAWGESTNYFNVRYVSYLTPDIWIDSNFSASDKNSITAKARGNAMINRGFPDKGLILAGGFDRYTMRSGGGASAVRSMVVKYLKNYPVALQLNTSFVRSDMNNRTGGNVGVSVQYGFERRWTVAAGGNYGRVHYELVKQPGTVADYRSTSYFTSGRYWLGNDWGVSARYSGVSNRHYTRNEAELGIFVDF